MATLGELIASLHPGSSSSYTAAQVRHTGGRLRVQGNNAGQNWEENTNKVTPELAAWLDKMVPHTGASIAGTGTKYAPCGIRYDATVGGARFQVPGPEFNRPYGAEFHLPGWTCPGITPEEGAGAPTINVDEEEDTETGAPEGPGLYDPETIAELAKFEEGPGWKKFGDDPKVVLDAISGTGGESLICGECHQTWTKHAGWSCL